MPIPASYKWVIVYSPRVLFLANKPRKVRGGFMDEHGNRWIYKGAKLMNRQDFEDFEIW